jgi:uncharacterized membrane protein YfcA
MYSNHSLFSCKAPTDHAAMIHILIVLCIFGTSVLSGILGMAGGMILMAILASTLSVAAAMLLHGAVQLTANGSRAWFLREHIQWHVLPWYALGAGVVLGVFSLFLLVPDAGVILLLIGLFSLGARFSGRFATLDITRPLTAASCGVVVTSAQLLAGASGPLLDVFYLNSPLSRHAVVANKALTQAFGHSLKIGYYGLVIGLTEALPLTFVLLSLAAALIGTRVGTRLLDRLNDDSFRRYSGFAISAIAAWCVAQGTWLLARAG